ncbi:glycosyl hydrolase [Natranaerobius thermophilus]|uniref:Glycosyl hydrolase BNR repeat-containing protein n=1 Tax=Natranaerobius thermophilus (strain ATCC BAA-1301 / DSM 18059 / JW/NM-WN-LF) TaxID=457570 RepID=B2A1P3_NATTJ|nr:glycosyl hydrolase [Natranaerobius thermophilus]ACB86090.1 glycosyl hydrolase BNR repeat-containing protein [Natranaerobius thermophilus JW/NM-WN-LF]
MNIEPARKFSGRVHFVNDSVLIATKANNVYISKDDGQNWKKILNLQLNFKDRFKIKNRWSRRLFRCDIHHLLKIDDHIILFLKNEIYVFDIIDMRVLTRQSLPGRGSRPLKVCLSNGNLYYGEYFGNKYRDPVRVYKSTDFGKTWEVTYVFNNIRHIHGIFEDPYTGNIWVTTGDSGDEAAIWVTNNDFKDVQPVLKGGQQFRAVTLLFTQDYIYYGTDTPLEDNYIYRLDKKDYNLEKLVKVDSSVFHGTVVNNNLFFSTACEPSEVNETRKVKVWMSRDGENWEVIKTFKKDILSYKYFQYGQVFFPYNAKRKNDNQLWITPFATNYDQVSFKYYLK